MKKYKSILIVCIIVIGIISISGCKKDNVVDPNIIKSGTEYGNIAKAVIGRGYDISERFASSEDIKESVLNFNKLTGDSKIIKDGNIAESVVTTREGETIEEYQIGFNYARSSNAGIDGLFSAEVGFNFVYGRAESIGYSYATVSSFTHKYGLYIDGRLNPTSLTDYVSSQFLSDAESMDMETLISIYGTHIIVAGKWGASYNYSMSARRKKVSNEFEFGAYVKAEATLEGINFGGSNSVGGNFSDYFEEYSKSVRTSAIGGDPEFILLVADAKTPEGRDLAYEKWLSSIEANPAFCDYYKGGLVPIYEFITDEALKSKLQTGIDTYLSGKGIESVEPVDKIIQQNFNEGNFCHITNGDGEIDADGGPVHAEMTFTIGEEMGDGNNLELKIYMTVEEKKNDYSRIEGEVIITIPNNEILNSINLSETSYTCTYDTNGFDPKNGQFIPITLTDLPFPWLTMVSICIDGSGSDEEHIAIIGILSVPVTVFPQ